MNSNISTWTLHGATGELNTDTLSGRVDVARPERGLHNVQLTGHRLAGQLFCISRQPQSAMSPTVNREVKPAWPLAVADSYIRGDDLVASYAPDDDWPYSPQIYWRANALESLEGLAGSLSLLMSVQTHLLDTWPRIVVGSHLACTEVLQVSMSGGEQTGAQALGRDTTIQPSMGDCCILRRLADVPISFVEFMPASDFRNVVVGHDDDGKCHVLWELFADFLEKGVIRRSRLHSAFVHRENDLELAAACCESISHSALPLTT